MQYKWNINVLICEVGNSLVGIPFDLINRIELSGSRKTLNGRLVHVSPKSRTSRLISLSEKIADETEKYVISVTTQGKTFCVGVTKILECASIDFQKSLVKPNKFGIVGAGLFGENFKVSLLSPSVLCRHFS